MASESYNPIHELRVTLLGVSPSEDRQFTFYIEQSTLNAIPLKHTPIAVAIDTIDNNRKTTRIYFSGLLTRAANEDPSCARCIGARQNNLIPNHLLHI